MRADDTLEKLRRVHAERAEEWTRFQGQRLRVRPDEVLLAVQRGLLPERIQQMSPVTFAAEVAGRSTIVTDPSVLRSLRKQREFWPRGRMAAQ